MEKRATRNFGLTDADLAALKAEQVETGKLPNPYRGNYGAIVAALISLGLNDAHPFANVRNAVKKEMGEKWDAFTAKEARNPNGKDADGRLLANVQVLMRRKDYGLKLTQLGAGIVKVKQPDGSLAFGLFLEGSRQPAPAAPAAAKTAAKGQKPTPKTKGAQKATGKPKKIAKKTTANKAAKVAPKGKAAK